jgi:hypothetical protein
MVPGFIAQKSGDILTGLQGLVDGCEDKWDFVQAVRG